jgi:signal transduction histidine kinase
MQHGFEDLAEGHIEIRAAILQGTIHLDYEDDGCGIDPEHINKVFDPFFTTKLGQGGSGLGLHIIYNLVTGLLGGDITMSSTPGQGVHATLHFPATAPVRHDTRMMNG